MVSCDADRLGTVRRRIERRMMEPERERCSRRGMSTLRGAISIVKERFRHAEPPRSAAVSSGFDPPRIAGATFCDAELVLDSVVARQ
jgi:hypothetical protein